ncbi:ATP-grasp fold amidoligase family protein [Arthrobacter sp. 2MCAF15]|uniref:ATP-grasp fold amidoligase family protein n=1 Tax=Arthrobacter sp. 2MCAF15 TaxID=3232984 RepID=UPI003F8DD19E
MDGISFLGLMRRRFNQRNDPGLDPVPWELDDKETAYRYVEQAGYAVPRYVRTSSAAEALAAGEQFGDRFVIKQPNRHSASGVYVLEKLGEGTYLDLLRMKVLAAADIKAVGDTPEYWLAEECIPSLPAGKPVPLDYKVYAFRGQISHITQIDRNVFPPRVALFDGAFIPLELGRDYSIDENRWLTEQHVLPRFAGAILEMASTLSQSLDTRFVKVDCYDGPDGPVFGEFTFASGGDDTGMLRYSERIIRALDAAMLTGRVAALSGFDIDLNKFREDLSRNATLVADEHLLTRLSGGASQGDARYAQLLPALLSQDSTRAVFSLAAYVIGHLSGDGRQAFNIQAALRRGGRHIYGTHRLAEFEEAAIAFHDERAAGNPWHAARAAEVRLASGDQSALETLRALASGGYEHARLVVARHTAAHATA